VSGTCQEPFRSVFGGNSLDECIAAQDDQAWEGHTANETKGRQKAAVSYSYTLKEGDTTDELILNLEDRKKTEKWSFYRERPGKPAPAPGPPAKKGK
jgi:hypothetical protein